MRIKCDFPVIKTLPSRLAVSGLVILMNFKLLIFKFVFYSGVIAKSITQNVKMYIQSHLNLLRKQQTYGRVNRTVMVNPFYIQTDQSIITKCSTRNIGLQGLSLLLIINPAIIINYLLLITCAFAFYSLMFSVHFVNDQSTIAV